MTSSHSARAMPCRRHGGCTATDRRRPIAPKDSMPAVPHSSSPLRATTKRPSCPISSVGRRHAASNCLTSPRSAALAMVMDGVNVLQLAARRSAQRRPCARHTGAQPLPHTTHQGMYASRAFIPRSRVKSSDLYAAHLAQQAAFAASLEAELRVSSPYIGTPSSV